MLSLKRTAAAVAIGALLAVSTALGQTDATPDPAAKIALYRLELPIDAPPDFIYLYLTDEALISRWNRDDGVSVSFPRGVEARLGKQIRVVIKAPTDPWLLMEIVRLDPGREVRTRFIDGALEGDFAWRLEPLDDRGALLIHEMRIRPKGALMTLAWALYGKHLHRSKMKTFMANIRRLVEAEWPGPVAASPRGEP